MTELLKQLFGTGDFMSHGHCYLWDPWLIRLHAGSDAAIAIAYVAIALTLTFFVARGRKAIPFSWIFLAFGIFILACGGTHLMEIWTLWTPVYWLSGALKLLTAAASVTTAIVLPPLIPKSLKVVRSAKVSEERKQELLALYESLQVEMAERQAAVQSYRVLTRELEARVAERTAELARQGVELEHSRQELLHKLNELETLYRTAPVGLAYLDADLRYVRINDQLAAMNGLPIEAHIGQRLHDLTPNLAQILQPVLADVLATGKPALSVEFTGPTAADSGRQHSFVGSYYPLRNGPLPGLSAVVQEVTERKKMEEQLRGAENRFALFMDNLPGAAWMKDLDGHYVYANATAARIFNRRLADLFGKTDDQLFAPEIAAQFRENDRRVIEHGNSLQTIETLPQHDGLHYSVVTKFLISDTRSGPILIAGVAIDITGQKQAEEKLRQQAEVLELAFDAIMILRLDGTIEYWNEGATQLYGWTKHEAIGDVSHHLLKSQFPERLPLMTMLMQNRWEGELTQTTRSGQRVVVSSRWALRTDAEGKPIGYLEINRDVTERRQALSAVALMAAIVESTEDAVIGEDGRGTILTWNRGAERIYGYSAQEAIGGSIEMLLPPGRVKEEHDLRDRLRKGEWIEHFETVRTRKGGTHIHVSLTLSPLRNKDGKVIGASHIARDITRQKRFEEQLRQTQKVESLGVLAGGVAHDFNNLLTGIIGNASLLGEQVSGTENGEFVEAIIQAGTQAADLTRQLLAYAGKGRFIIQPLNCSELIREIRALVNASIPKSVQLHMDLADQLPIILADVGQVQQTVMNLITNGAEAIENVGTIWVRTLAEHVDSGYLRKATGLVDEMEPGEYVAVEVEDTGCGMNEQTREKIFDPFFSTKFTGRGLGLAAVRGIVRGHKGGLELYSTPGLGTTFRVLFPVAGNGIPRPIKEGVTVPTALHGNGTILVVDDEELVRNLARSILERSGYAVVMAGNGKEAIQVVEARGGELTAVLLDMTMPIMTGEEALPVLKGLVPHLRVIGSSGYSEAEALRRFGARELAGFVQKPYKSADLVDAIKRVLTD